jgi:hypothetical protein
MLLRAKRGCAKNNIARGAEKNITKNNVAKGTLLM